MAFYKNIVNVHHNLSPTRIQRDEEDVKATINVINENFISPFEEQELVSSSNGVLSTEKITSDLLTAEEKGLSALNTSTEERLVKQTMDFYEPIKKLKLSTFSEKSKSAKIKTQDKIVQLTAEKNVFGRIAMMSQHKNIDMKEIFAFPLSLVPWALADSMGTLKKTNKAILIHELENVELAEPNEEVVSNTCTVIDGMALVRKIKTAGLTYEEFALKLLNTLLSTSSSSSRIDVVFDVHQQISIKNAERARRKSGSFEFKKIVGSQQIKQWTSFLSSVNNKTELIKFTVEEWKNKSHLLNDKLLYVTCEEKCFMISDGNLSTEAHLDSTQEEADTRLLLHAHDASVNYHNIVIQTRYADVLILAIAMRVSETKLYVKTGKQSKLRLIDVEKVVDGIDYNKK